MDLPTNIQSPNAASLGKYGDVPVSYFTGTPQVSIPLHTISERGINIPITLSYDASGIRLNSHPGWVGQNWSLSAGGVITRTVRGLPDEYNTIGTHYASTFEDSLGFMYRGGLLTESSVGNISNLMEFAIDADNKGYDLEPDIFTFNFLGKTGKFFMGNDGQWKVLSDDNLKIIFDKTQLIYPGYQTLPGDINHCYPKVIGGFKIKDDQGVTYVFGYNQDAVEFGIDFYTQVYGGAFWKSDAWYLTKIIDKFGNEVFNFTYQRGDFIAQFYRTTGVSISRFHGHESITKIDPSCYNPGYINEDQDIEGELISPVYLSSITSTNNTITFSNSISSEKTYDTLDFNKAYNIIDECNKNSAITPPFFYIGEPTTKGEVVNLLKFHKLDGFGWGKGYVKFTYNNNPNERLNLLKVDTYAEDYYYEPSVAKKFTYKFTYNQFDSLPGYMSKKIDHWGYYNGVDYIVNSADFSNYKNQRAPNPAYLQVGMLTSITYPTGGITSFEYEPHSYSQCVADDHSATFPETNIAGGLRIRRILNYDGIKTTTKTFKYIADYETNKNSEISSGVLFAKPKYYWPNWQVDCQTYDVINGTYSAGIYLQSVFSVNSIIPLSNTFGPYIGYSKVEEIRDDGSYTVYEYSNYGVNNSYYDESSIGSLNLAASPYDQYSDMGLTRGKLLKVKVYNADNAPLQEKRLYYRSDLSSLLINSNYFVIGTNASCRIVCSGNNLRVFKGNAYKIFCFNYDVVNESTTNYFNGSSIAENTLLTKQDYFLPNANIRLTKQVQKIVSNGYQTTNYSYPLDLQLEPNVGNLVDSFRVGELIETQTLKNERPIGVKKITYKIENGICIPDIYYTSGTDEASLQPEVYYDKHDRFGNILQYHKFDGIYHSILWDYSQAFPIYMGVNIGYDGLNEYVNAIRTNPNDSTIRNKYHNVQITSITYSTSTPRDIISISDPNNQSQYFNYDLFDRLKSILDNDMKVLKHYDYNYAEPPSQ